MNRRQGLVLVSMVMAVLSVSMLAGQDQGAREGRGAQSPAAPEAQPGHGTGKLVIFADVAVFSKPADPENCFLRNRFKRGQRIGWRITAKDGGTGEVENTAVVVGHITYGGRTVDVQGRWRGAPWVRPNPPATPRGYLSPPTNLWNVIWTVPDDAPVGAVSYTITATDRFGRTAEFTPFSYENSQLAIVD